MSTASWQLQVALHATLIQDADLMTGLGGAKIYDHVPRGTKPPYVTLAQTTERDWSTGGAEGSEHTVTLHVWSQAYGRKQVQSLMAAIRSALHENEAAITLSGNALITLRHELSEVRREPDGDTLRGLVRFRAVTEPTG